LAAAGDIGQPLQRTDLADRSVHVTGTFAGATIVLEGSNDGTNYFTLANPAGAALSFTRAGLMAGQPTDRSVRPRVNPRQRRQPHRNDDGAKDAQVSVGPMPRAGATKERGERCPD